MEYLLVIDYIPGKILTAVRDKLKEDPDEEEDNKVSTATIVQQVPAL